MPLRLTYLLCAVLLAGAGCSKEFANDPAPNQPPDTFLFLRPDSALRETTSQQHLHWWGVDADGFVVGFFFSFDSTTWTYTARNDSLLALSFSRPDTTFHFYVAAFDNHGNGRYDGTSPYGPEPFLDQNANGRWDAGEPFVDVGSVDVTPAALRIPVANSPPQVSFVLRSDVPETTYTVATFQWNATDFDGDETIDRIFYALDDTSSASRWRELDGSFKSLTLFRNRVLTPSDPPNYRNDSLSEGNHILYLKVRDIAGAVSNTIRMPEAGKRWYVREPKGDFLIVDDYLPTDAAAGFYGSLFDTLMGGRLKARDVLDIKRGASSIKRGDLVPALINPTLTETLKLFKYIFWYADNGPSLEIAQSTLPEIKRSGTKVLFVSGFPENVTGQGSLVDFAPIANVEPGFFTNRLNAGDSLLTVSDPSYPPLVRDNLGTIYTFPRGILPKVDARVLYRMQGSTRWAGQPIMGVKDADQASFVLVAVLLHRFGTPPLNVARLMRKVYAEEFGVQ
ncbi:MAG: hypothetical protein MUE68_00015 [Bacteroidetes bacterium]|jgi:hypothetical protein|nr:hypothetical protein [Bacteroidota bacterium]